jgi:L-lactate dehydrogenase
MKKPVIAIVGMGAVGTTSAFALVLKSLASTLLLVDVDEKRCQGEVLDLEDASCLSSTSLIKHSTFKEVATQADIIVITAGQRQKPGQSRDELLQANKNIIASIMHNLGSVQSHAIILMVSNPLDTITWYAQQLSTLTPNQIIGSGTYLDSLRARELLAAHLHIDSSLINAYIVAEHGDSQVAAWSLSSINNVPLLDYPGLNPSTLDTIAQQVKKRAYQIIDCKGATFYGIGSCVADICDTIINNKQTILPLSNYQAEYDLYFSTPVLVGKTGIIQKLPLTLTAKEQEQMAVSIDKLKKAKQLII